MAKLAEAAKAFDQFKASLDPAGCCKSCARAASIGLWQTQQLAPAQGAMAREDLGLAKRLLTTLKVQAVCVR